MINIKKILAVVLSTALVFTGCAQKPTGEKAPSVLQDGTYTAEAKSHGGPLTVEMVCKDGKITALTVLSHQDDEDYAVKATENLPGEIIKAQSLGVDVIAGATMTSRGILGAAAQCLRDAGGNARDFGYVPTGEVADGQVITIQGLTGEDVVINGEKIKSYASVQADTVSVNASGESTPTLCTGVLLETILQELGTSQKDYGSIMITATDGYAIEIPADVLQIRDIIIAYEVNGEACDLRTVVPDERAMYWVKFIDTIELMNRVQEELTETLYFSETITQEMDKQEYKYKGAADQAVLMADLLEAMDAESDFVTLMALDGWGKDDKWDVVQGQYFKITGEDAPMFIGPDLPEGMRLKNTLFIKSQDKTLASAQMFTQKLEATTFTSNAKEYQGVALTKIFEETLMQTAEKYTFTAADGYEVTLTKAEAEKGYISYEDGTVIVRFENLDKSTTVKQLASIEAEE